MRALFPPSLLDPFHPGRVSTVVVLLSLGLFLGACDSNSDSPPTGTLGVSVSTSGEMTDSDGYTLQAAKQSSDVGSNGSVILTEVTEGPQQVSLSGLAANCSVNGSNPRSVVILQGDTTDVSFGVTCQSTSGAVEVAVATSGIDVDPDGYILTVDGSDSADVAVDDTTTITNVEKGSREIGLSDLQNCSIQGDHRKTVRVAAGETATTSFQIRCPTTLRDAIAFTSDRDGNNNIHVLGTDGSGPIQITTNSRSDQSPSVSPDGNRIAFTSGRTGSLEIYTITPDGSDLTQVTTNGGGDPSWAPDGNRIAFTSFRNGDADIYTIRPDGSGLVHVASSSTNDMEPDWSPSGDRIAFRSRRDGDKEIYTINPDGTNPNRVTTTSGFDGTPDWSPDGSRIAFSTTRSSNTLDIFTIKPDGSGLTQITSNGAQSEAHPDWSPGGGRIAFDQSGNIRSIKSDGSDNRRITYSSSANNVNPSWSPSK